MTEPPVNPMVPYLTGYLLGSLMEDGGQCMKVGAVDAGPPDRFTVQFASGLKLEVSVKAVPPAPNQPDR